MENVKDGNHVFTGGLRMPRAPRLQLTSAFRAAIVNDSRGIVRLSALAGYSAYPNFSKILRHSWFSGTSLHQERLRRVADAIGFTGTLWHERRVSQ